MKRSVAKQLRVSVFFLLALACVSTLIALTGFWVMHQLQRSVIKNQVSALQISSSISVQSERLIVFSERLFAASTLAELNEYEVVFGQHMDDVGKRLIELRSFEISEELVQGVNIPLSRLKREHNQSVGDAKKVMELKATFDEMHSEVLKKQQEFKEKIEPYAIDAELEYLDAFSDVHDILAKQRIDKILTEKGIDKVQLKHDQANQIQNAQFIIDIIRKDLDALYIMQDVLDIDTKQNEYMLSIRELSRLILSSDVSHLSTLSPLVNNIFQLSALEGNVFEVKRDLVKAMQREIASKRQVRSTISDISAAVNGVVEYVGDKNKKSEKSLYRQTYFFSSVLIFILVASFLGYLFLIKILLFKGLLTPLLELTSVTKRLSQGEHYVEIVDYDMQELSDMARALDIFRKNAEDLEVSKVTLEETNSHLIQANHDLENFAYAASHDLKSPLRGVCNLVTFLRDDLGDEVSIDIKQNLELIESRINRLEHLLDDLLEYAKAGKNSENVSLKMLPEYIEEIFSLVNVGGGFKLHVSHDISCISSYITPLSQIIRNIFDNSIKHNDRSSGVIQVNIKEKNNRYLFEIEDDGPGIDGRYHEKIFQIFQTLKPRDEVEGSGMGLALTAKIVGQFGGNIKVYSEPAVERGACFIFDWPRVTTSEMDGKTKV